MLSVLICHVRNFQCISRSKLNSTFKTNTKNWGMGVHLGYMHFLYIILLEYTNSLKRHQIKWLYSIMTSPYKYTLQKYNLNRFYLFFDTNLYIFGYQVEIFKILWKLFSFITYPYRVYIIHVYSKCSNHFRTALYRLIRNCDFAQLGSIMLHE